MYSLFVQISLLSVFSWRLNILHVTSLSFLYALGTVFWKWFCELY